MSIESYPNIYNAYEYYRLLLLKNPGIWTRLVNTTVSIVGQLRKSPQVARAYLCIQIHFLSHYKKYLHIDMQHIKWIFSNNLFFRTLI